ncbi:response regulator transcription factor [Albibacterium sp.]|uniref:response regulator transcription factor n=1 Tax=Albibacterium sp. TaxID=2952885 RepID=UPI002C717247|nr:response regulator transcription factor [Albibacterium sp.]HUH18911.1 response regulator transcription factor [Albibacterium sp.]
MQKKIVIIDDNKLIRESLRMILESEKRFQVINTYSDCESAITNLEQDAPDVILLDIQLPGISGIEGTKLIHKKLPDCIILIITVSEDSDQVFKSLCAGASGYIVKCPNLNVIKEAVDEALAGGAPMSLQISKMVVESFQKHAGSPLSERESQVLQSISEGKSYSKIAEDLFISKETVKTHIKNIYRKLEVVTKEDAIRIAHKNKWVQRNY